MVVDTAYGFGTTDTETQVTADKSYTGFTAKAIEQKTIKADGSTVVEVFYDRIPQSITYTGGTGFSFAAKNPDKVLYGGSYTFSVTVADGYDPATLNVKVNNTQVSGAIVGSTVTFTVPNAVAEQTITATVNPIQVYEVSYDANGGAGIPPVGRGNVKVGDVIQLVENGFTKAGYVFVGWSTNQAATSGSPAGSYTVQPSDVADGKITFYAIWAKDTAVTYTVEHYTQNTDLSTYTLADEQTFYGITDQEVTAIAKTYTGFVFNEQAEDSVLTGTIAANGTLTLKVYYDRETYGVTLTLNGGTLKNDTDNVTEYTYGVVQNLPTAEHINAPDGYTFGGWYAISDFTGTPVTAIAATETGAKTYYAKWVAGTGTTYTVEHHKEKLDGGYEVDKEPMTGVTGGQTNAAAKTYEGFTPDHFEQQTIKPDGNTVVHIYYQRITYTVTFEPNNGGMSVTQNVKYEGAVTEPNDPVKAGYTFAGWYLENTPWDFTNGKVTSNITLTARWTSAKGTAYTVHHYQEALDGTKVLVDTVTEYGETGQNTNATIQTYEGFAVKSVEVKPSRRMAARQ